MKRFKTVIKSVVAVTVGAICLSNPILAYANYYDYNNDDVGSYSAYREAYVGETVAGAFARTGVNCDIVIDCEVEDIFGLTYPCNNSADQYSYCESSYNTGNGMDFVKYSRATVQIWSPDGYNSRYVATVNPYVSR